MLIIGVLVLLVVLLLTGLPLVFAMGTASVAYLFFADISLSMLTQRMTTAVDSFLILAIPFFYLAGELMNACKLTDKIVTMSKALVGHIHGGLAQVNIFASMIFAGMSGSATADTAALGSVLIPAMKKEKYDADFAAAVTVASAMVGPIIPPSIGMVIYGGYQFWAGTFQLGTESMQNLTRTVGIIYPLVGIGAWFVGRDLREGSFRG